MKRLIPVLSLWVLSLLIFPSCQNDGGENNGNADTLGVNAPTNLQSQEYIEGRINDIYESAFSALSSEEDTDLKYFTDDFFSLQKKVIEKQRETEMIYIDHNHWVMAQDCENPSFMFDRAEEIGNHYAKAYVRVKPFASNPSTTLVRLTLKYNGEDWMIDDIEEEYDGVFYSHRKMYEEALAN